MNSLCFFFFPLFFNFCLCLLSISLWGLGETAPKQDHHSNGGMMASQRQPDSVEWCISLYLSLFLSVCVCACVYVLCVHLGVGIISQPKKKKRGK
jgi:succinate dehydrogenase/fumarate reductase cytochrome b subunit